MKCLIIHNDVCVKRFIVRVRTVIIILCRLRQSSCFETDRRFGPAAAATVSESGGNDSGDGGNSGGEQIEEEEEGSRNPCAHHFYPNDLQYVRAAG